jgi:glycosyltransferase involved in cell wall biosynthesis
MARILVLNNYPLEEVWDEVLKKDKPDHHLFGINHLRDRGFDVEIIPFERSQILQRISRLIRWSRFPVPVGDLDQQWQVIRDLNEADLIYSPCQTQTYLLNYLRASGMIKVPIVCLAHHPLNRGRLAHIRAPFIKLLINGTDAFPSLSISIANAINRVANEPDKSRALRWGPDADYYPYAAGPGEGVVAAGRTGRDFHTFGVAASQTGIPTQMICLEGSVSSNPGYGKNIKLTVYPTDRYMKYPELLDIYAKARVLAIPLLAGSSLSGLTSLMDALGMGKPVIMTRHPLIDLDIEAMGIGKWVEPGDVDGWREAIQFFDDNESEAISMGLRARRLVEAGMNSVSFTNQLIEIFDGVLTKTLPQTGSHILSTL